MIYQTVKYNMRMVMWSVSSSSYEKETWESKQARTFWESSVCKKVFGFLAGVVCWLVGWLGGVTWTSREWEESWEIESCVWRLCKSCCTQVQSVSIPGNFTSLEVRTKSREKRRSKTLFLGSLYLHAMVLIRSGNSLTILIKIIRFIKAALIRIRNRADLSIVLRFF